MKTRKKFPTTINKMINKEIKFSNYIPQVSHQRKLFFITLFSCIVFLSVLVLSIVLVVIL